MSGPLNVNQAIVDLSSVQAWGTRYFEVDPDPALPAVIIEVESAGRHAATNSTSTCWPSRTAPSWTSGQTWAQSMNRMCNNGPDYDRMALVVASMGQAVNFQYGFNLADGLVHSVAHDPVPSQSRRSDLAQEVHPGSGSPG